MSNLPENECIPIPASNDKGKTVCTSESFSSTDNFRELNIVSEDVKNMQNKIEQFFGISEDDPVFLEIENSFYENLIALNNIPTDLKEGLNQKKHEVVLLIQRQLQNLNLKLQDNQAQQKGVKLDLFTECCDSKKDSQITISVETPKNLEVIEEMEECPFVSHLPTLENKQLTKTYEDSKFDEFALELLGHAIKESEKLKSFAHNVPFSPETRPIRLKTAAVPNSNKRHDNNKKNTNPSLIKCILPQNVFTGLFKTLRDCGNAVLGFIFPTVEIGNRLALKRIQVILLHMRFLLTFLILEIPLMTAVIFYGLYTSDMHQIE